MGIGEITRPFLDCILIVNPRQGKKYGLIKTYQPNNPIRFITSGNSTAVENLSLFTEYFLHPCVKKEPQILIDTTALLNKITDINNKFSPFPEGILLVSWNVISLYPCIDNEVGLAVCMEALVRGEKLSPKTKCLHEAVKITLECNNSTFNRKHYHQNHIISFYIISYHIILSHLISFYLIAHHLISFYIIFISCHIIFISYHIILYQIISFYIISLFHINYHHIIIFFYLSL